MRASAPDEAQARSAADDRQEIMQQIYRYCRAMDRMDVELGYSIWHEDGEADYGKAIYRGSGRGFIDFVTASHAGMIAHSHQVTTVIVTLDGERAASESYVTAALRFAEGDRLKEITARGRYCDRWSFREGKWAIDRRIYLHDFDDVREVVPTALPSISTRDRTDPSYRTLSR